uniref:Uncharacterized protein n=1 Tax=Setaria italica TaxID=4555 RepID=K4AN04_SETIT
MMKPPLLAFVFCIESRSGTVDTFMVDFQAFLDLMCLMVV